MKKSSRCKFCIKFCSVECLNFTGDSSICFFENIENGARWVCLTFYTEIFTIINENTRSICVIIKVSVHTTNNVITKILLIVFCHECKFFMRPVLFLGHILINLVITRYDRNIWIRWIYLNNMKHLSTVICCIVNNHLRFSGSTWNKIIILFR